MSKINDCNKIVLPEPHGADIIIDAGNLGATSYLDCLKSYSFTLTGLTIGVIIIHNKWIYFIIKSIWKKVK